MTKHLNFRRHRILAIGTAAAAIVAGGGSLALGADGASAQQITARQEASENWSGYVVESSAGQNFSSISGSWVQPAVSSSAPNDGYAAFWVGLGGAGQQSQALEQVGTAVQVVSGQTTYSAWYELVPSSLVTLPLTINAGDHMTGKVAVDGNNVTISLSDQTSGQSVTKTLQMSNPDTSSAEWIAEAPTAEMSDGSSEVLPLADFGSVTFTNASATAGGHTGSINDPAWTVRQVDMSPATAPPFGGGGGFGTTGIGLGLPPQSTAGASAGDLSSDGTTFTVTYSPQATGTGGSVTADSREYVYPGSGHGGYRYHGPGHDGYGYAGPGFVYRGHYLQ